MPETGFTTGTLERAVDVVRADLVELAQSTRHGAWRPQWCSRQPLSVTPALSKVAI